MRQECPIGLGEFPKDRGSGRCEMLYVDLKF